MKLFSRTNYITYFFCQTCAARMLFRRKPLPTSRWGKNEFFSPNWFYSLLRKNNSTTLASNCFLLSARLLLRCNEWVESNPIRSLCLRTDVWDRYGENIATHWKVWREFVPTSKETILERDYSFFCHLFIRNGFR